MLKALLIDLDGTLADSLPILYKVYSGFLKQYNIEGTKEEFQELNGLTLFEVMQKLVSRYQLPETAEQLTEKYRSHLFSDYVSRLELFPSAKQCLVYAKERGLQIALVTSARKELVTQFLQKQNILHYFAAVITSDGLTRGKPSPEIYLKALDHLHVQPEEALAIEDAHHGIAAAVAAHIPVLRFNPENLPPSNQQIVHEVSDWKTLRHYLETFTIENPNFFLVDPVKITVQNPPQHSHHEKIEEIWEAQKKIKPRLFNGQILCADTLTNDELRGYFVEYKLLVAQLNDDKLALNLTPVSISGIISNGPNILMGKRAQGLNVYEGMYEAVPSGGIDPVSQVEDHVDVNRQVSEELYEETDLTEQEVQEITPFALLKDKAGGTWEVCARITTTRQDLVHSPSGEYQELFWLPKEEILDFIAEHYTQVVPCTRFLLVNFCS